MVTTPSPHWNEEDLRFLASLSQHDQVLAAVTNLGRIAAQYRQVLLDQHVPASVADQALIVFTQAFLTDVIRNPRRGT